MSGSLTIPAAGDTLDALSDAGTGRDGLDGAPTSLAVAELAARLCRQRIRVEQAALANWLLDWQRQGIAEQIEPGRWRLTEEGARRFSLVGQIEPR